MVVSRRPRIKLSVLLLVLLVMTACNPFEQFFNDAAEDITANSSTTRTTLPELAGARAFSNHYVSVTFAEPADATAAQAERYVITAPDGTALSVTEARLHADQSGVTLTTGAQQDVTYRLTMQADTSPSLATTRASTGSSSVTFTGSIDDDEPFLASAIALSNTAVLLTFSEAMQPESVETRAFYRIDAPTLAILHAEQGEDAATMLLTTAPQQHVEYTVKVTNVKSADGSMLINPLRSTASFFGLTAEDQHAPRLVSAISTSATEVLASFSEPLAEHAAEPTHFLITVDDLTQPPTVQAGIDQTIVLGEAVTLGGSVANGALTGLSTAWQQVSGPGTATFDSSGSYVLRLEATLNNGTTVVSDEVVIGVLDPTPVPVEQRVAAGPNDAEESPSGSVSRGSDDLDLGAAQTVGLRFTGLPVPPGARIINAVVQFTADKPHTAVTTLTIVGEASDNAAAFTTDNGDITSRPGTEASVAWNPPAWTAGATTPDQQTPNLAPIFQEIVDRPGWANGNAVVLTIAGSGERAAESFEGSATKAPLLRLEYLAPVSNHPPRVYAGTDQLLPLGVQATLRGTVDDDARPALPGAIAVLWEQVSGPGQVSLADDTALETTATFSQSGIYVLRLTADDGELHSSDEVVLTVITPALGITAAQSRTYGMQVLLTTLPQVAGLDYTLVVLQATDLAGNPIDPQGNTASFTFGGAAGVADSTIPPRMVGAISTSNTTVVVTFNKAMGDSAAEPGHYSIVQENINPEAGTVLVTGARFLRPDRTAVELTT